MIINTGEYILSEWLLLSCFTVVIAFCNRGYTNGRVITLNPRHTTSFQRR